MLTLREAARDAGTSKSSLHRAIKAGRLSVTRTETGEIRIDPSELARAYPPRPSQSSRPVHPEPEPVGYDGTGIGTGGLTARCASAEAEVRVLRQMIEDMKA